MAFSEAALAALAMDQVRIGVFFYLGTEPLAIRLWLGVGQINSGPTSIDAGGAMYYGFGQVKDVPALQQLINGVSERVEFVLDGVDATILALAGSEQNAVRGKVCMIGLGIFDDDYHLVHSPQFVWRGVADYLSIRQSADGENGVVRQILLSVGTPFVRRRRPHHSWLSDADQQARQPGDKFCERTSILAAGVQKAWPRFP